MPFSPYPPPPPSSPPATIICSDTRETNRNRATREDHSDMTETETPPCALQALSPRASARAAFLSSRERHAPSAGLFSASACNTGARVIWAHRNRRNCTLHTHFLSLLSSPSTKMVAPSENDKTMHYAAACAHTRTCTRPLTLPASLPPLLTLLLGLLLLLSICLSPALFLPTSHATNTSPPPP